MAEIRENGITRDDWMAEMVKCATKTIKRRGETSRQYIDRQIQKQMRKKQSRILHKKRRWY